MTRDWGLLANRALWLLTYGNKDWGMRPLATYEPGYRAATDRSLLDRVLKIKRDLVELVEQAERDGTPWEASEFIDVMRELVTNELSAERERRRALPAPATPTAAPAASRELPPDIAHNELLSALAGT